jgi:non-ribosomal peptide synthetase component F
MGALLAALAAGGEPDLPPLASTYAEFAAEQRDLVGSEGGAALLAWWVSELQGAAPPAYLAPDGPDPSGERAGERIRVLDRELLGCLRALTARHRLTPFMAAISLVVMALASLSDERELCLATGMASRPARWADVQGSFANTLVLRVELPERAALDDVAAAVRRAVLRTLAHRDLPHQVVSRALGSGWRQPPLRIGYLANRGHQFTSLDGRAWGEEWTEETDFSSTPVDLGFAEDGRGRVALWLNYDARLFTHALMKGLVEATLTALRLASADPALTCARLAEALAPAAPALGSPA